MSRSVEWLCRDGCRDLAGTDWLIDCRVSALPAEFGVIGSVLLVSRSAFRFQVVAGFRM